MQNDRLKNLLHLHFIVFIWGFTAVLGKLITIDAAPLVWYRMLIATILILGYVLIRKVKFKFSKKTMLWMIIGGVIIALHWVTFFMAIKVSNVSVALATMSIGTFFTAFLEPLWYKRKIIKHEVIFGLVVILGLYYIFKVDTTYWYGMLLAAVSAFLASCFTLINGNLIKEEIPSVISLFELGFGVLFLTVYFLFNQQFTTIDFFKLSFTDLVYLLVLASICTAYAFIASVKVMRHLSPYTVMLTINLEPVYGIVLAFIVLGENKQITSSFYIGALIIITVVVLNGILKSRLKLKNK